MTPSRWAKIQQVLARRQPDVSVFLEGVHKPHNFSAILRSCEATGVGAAHCLPRGEGFRTARGTASGAHKWVHVTPWRDAIEAHEALKLQGFTSYCAHFSDRAVDFRAPDYTKPSLIVLGTEKFGVSEELAATCDEHITIPMLGMVQSLNVSVACALILYEVQRQREAIGAYEQPALGPDTINRLAFEWAHPRVARWCRERDRDYPALDEYGEIIGGLPGA